MKIMPKYQTDDKGNVTLVDIDHCGPICQVKKRVSGIRLGIKKQAQKRKAKKMEKLGFSGRPTSTMEYYDAKQKAEKKGRVKAQSELQKTHFATIEAEAYAKAGGKVGKPQSMFDQIMGGGSKPQASSTPRRKQRKVKPQFQVHGGKLYQVQQPKVKTKRKNLTKRTKKGNGVKKVANFFGASNGSSKRSKKSNKDPFGINSTDWSFGL